MFRPLMTGPVRSSITGPRIGSRRYSAASKSIRQPVENSDVPTSRPPGVKKWMAADDVPGMSWMG
jgi:hypothetical protein